MAERTKLEDRYYVKSTKFQRWLDDKGAMDARSPSDAWSAASEADATAKIAELKLADVQVIDIQRFVKA